MAHWGQLEVQGTLTCRLMDMHIPAAVADYVKLQSEVGEFQTSSGINTSTKMVRWELHGVMCWRPGSFGHVLDFLHIRFPLIVTQQ